MQHSLKLALSPADGMIHAGVNRAATQCEKLGSGSWGVHACSAPTKSRRLCTSAVIKSGGRKAMNMRNIESKECFQM